MRTALLSVTLLLGVGCANDPCALSPADAPTEHMTLRHPGVFDQIALQGGRIFGPDTEVTRYEDEYRGHAFRRSVDLRVQSDLIEGAVGNGRTELHVQRLDDGFAMQGLYAGNLGQLILRSDRLEGHLGGRVYRLRANPNEPGVYESIRGPADAPGTRTTGAIAGFSAGPTEVVLPTGFASLPPEHQGTLLAIFLGR